MPAPRVVESRGANRPSRDWRASRGKGCPGRPQWPGHRREKETPLKPRQQDLLIVGCEAVGMLLIMLVCGPLSAERQLRGDGALSAIGPDGQLLENAPA